MKLAIISDTHFGHPDCNLVIDGPGSPQVGARYEQFKNIAGTDNDYLVLVGDILDFALSDYSVAYKCGKCFFEQIILDRVINKNTDIIYIPGNHDGDIWHIIQHQRHIINRIGPHGIFPEKFQHSVAGILDDRAGSVSKGLTLNKVTPRPPQPGVHKYSGMFLDKLTDPETHFNFAYPNLYLVTDTGECVLISHGHYFEPYWSFLGEFTMDIAYDDLGHPNPDADISMEEKTDLNFPLNQLACTGVGQAGIFSERIVTPVEEQPEKVKKYFSRLTNAKETLGLSWLTLKAIQWLFQSDVVDALNNKTRFRDDWVADPKVKQRGVKFFESSLLEIDEINKSNNFNLPHPQRLIIGHTHQPIAWNDPDPPDFGSFSDKKVTWHNTGGWIEKNRQFCGAEVFVYETGKGMSSHSVK